jgi:hypothetical protein
MTRIDHVVMAAFDLEQGAALLQAEHGLATVPGGRHPDFGTSNRVFPMAEQYLELVAVTDPERAARHPFGRAVAAQARPGEVSALAVCLKTPDLEAVAARLRLPIESGHRTSPEGKRISWRTVGLAEACSSSRLPFFIDWDSRSLHPSHLAADDRTRSARFTLVEVGGDHEQVAGWVGAPVSNLVVTGGGPGIQRVTISFGDGVTVSLG